MLQQWEQPPLPALVISATHARYERARAVLVAHGFSVRRSPAVFVTSSGNETTPCRGFNGQYA